MACCHVAHDCQLGDRIILANCALLAGHVKVEDGVILSGHTAVHHFVTLGTVCMLGGPDRRDARRAAVHDDAD